jgi:type IV secretory pathway TraG/TraD family ATPase VirD4
MRPTQPNRPPSDRHVNVGLAAIAVVLALSAAVWTTAHLAAMVTRRPVRLGFADSGGLLIRWGMDPFVSDQASPTPALFGGQQANVKLPASDQVLQLSTLALVLGLVAIIAAGWLLLRRRPAQGHRRIIGARWGTARDLRSILVRPGRQGGRLILGELQRRIGRRQLLAVEELHSVFVLGPTQSRKTSGLAIPALLEWAGRPAIVTSVKRDLYDATNLARGLQGEVRVFDPAGFLGDEGACWNPLATVTSWAKARELAKWLVEASAEHKEEGDSTKGFFERRGARPLAAALWAAAIDNKPIGQVRRWLDELASEAPAAPRGVIEPARYNDAAEHILAILAIAQEEDAIIALKSVLDETERQRSGSITSAQDALDVFADEAVERACTPGQTFGGQIDPDRLLDGAGTLYLYAPLHEQDRLRPVFEALIMSVVRTAMERTARTGHALDRPLLVLLDEAGNVAPIRQLAQLASTGAGQAIQLLTVFQDLAQLRVRYGQQAPTVINNHRAKVLLSGLSDPDSLDYVSRLIGDSAELEESTTTGEDRSSTTAHVAWRRLAPMALLRATLPGEGVVLYGHLPPAKLRLRWWEQDKDLARMAGPTPERRQASGQHHDNQVRGDRRVVQLRRRRRRRRAA